VDIIDAVSRHLKADISSTTLSSKGESGFFVWNTPHGSIQAPFTAGLDGGIQIGVTSLDSIPGCLWVPFSNLQALGFQDGEFLVRYHTFKAWLKPHSPDSSKDGAASMADSTSGSRASDPSS
jgi:hypothetical protein